MRDVGIVLDLANQRWFFHNNPRKKSEFCGVDFRLFERPEIAAEDYTFWLRESEAQHLDDEQRSELNLLLKRYADIFHTWEVATPIVKHYIDTGNSPPVVVPPYRMSPLKKELLKNELELLISNGTIEDMLSRPVSQHKETMCDICTY